jgi:hypothetical protein
MKQITTPPDNMLPYTTYDEIAFINGIGRWGISSRNKKRLLHNYVSTLNSRSWDTTIEPLLVISHAQMLLDKMNGKY